MKLNKEMIKRGLLGALFAIFVDYTILMLYAGGHSTITLDVEELFKHYFFYGACGFYFSAISIYFSIEKWSILRQYLTHVLSTLPFLPIAYFMGMMPNGVLGKLTYLALYLSSYLISFIIYLSYLKKQTALINAKL